MFFKKDSESSSLKARKEAQILVSERNCLKF